MAETNLWALVKKDPYNPHFWTELVQVAESTKNFDGIVRAYRGFLERFPLMHIYWNKYALVVQQHNATNSVRDALDIFDHAVAPGVLSASVEMWEFYCDFVTKYNFDITEDDIRAVFERALASVGRDYSSDCVWSMYIRWEEEKGNYDRVSALFARVLNAPIRSLNSFWNSFAEHAINHSIEKAASPKEKEEIDVKINEIADNDVSLTVEELNNKTQQMIYDMKHQCFLNTMEKLSTTVFYEYKIRRSYFHFQKPGELQIANWYEYINYVMCTETDPKRVKHLFERCLIPCNFCPEMWIKYASYVASIDMMEVQEILKRADASPLGRDPEYQRLKGLFLESLGQYDMSNAVFKTLEDNGTAAAAISYSSFLIREGNRNGNIEEMKIKAINHLLKVMTISKPKEYTAILGYIVSLGKQIDTEKLLSQCHSNPLAIGIHIRSCIEFKNIEKAKEIFKTELLQNNQLSFEDKLTLIPIYKDFLKKNNGTIQEIREAERKFVEVQKLYRIELLNKRREECKNVNCLNEVIDRWILYLQEFDALSQ